MKITAKIFLSLLFLILTLSCAQAAGTAKKVNSGESLPRVSLFVLQQVGGADLMVEIWGRGLPLPQVSSSGNVTEIVLSGVSGEKARKYEYDGMAPLVTAVRSAQSGEDFVITIAAAEPLEQKEVRGVPPANIYTLYLRTSAESKRAAEERAATAQPQTARVPAGPFASSTPVTLDLRDAELRDIFRMFGEQIKKNIIIHDSMPAALVTMTFENSPLSSVFGYLMKNYDLAYELIDNNTILIGTAAGLARISGKEETRVYRIAYADPAVLSALLPNLTRITAANLVVDPRLRTVYATGTPDIQEEVAIAVQKLDNPGKQVMLHARILQFSNEDSLNVSTTLNAVYDHWAFNYDGTTGLSIDYNESNNSTYRYLDASLRALETKTRTKTLAAPSVITINGVEATINLTQDYPYVSGHNEYDEPEWSVTEVGPQLKMTPLVGRGNMITLTLDLQTSEVIDMRESSNGEEMPVTSKRQAVTNVRVRNGEPFVIGGLIREDKANDIYSIPILGHIPLLGELFTFRINETRASQVVMVVIPYILETPDVGVEYERLMIRQ